MGLFSRKIAPEGRDVRLSGDISGLPQADGYSFTNLDVDPPAFTTPTTAVAAAECASGMIERVISTAQVEAPPLARPALTQDLLALAVRGMVMTGEAALLLDTTGGEVKFFPCWHEFRTARDVFVSVPQPEGDINRLVSIDSLVVAKWSIDQRRPWKGIGPFSQVTSSLGASTEAMLQREARGKSGYAYPYSRRTPTEHGADFTSSVGQQLNEKLAKAGAGDVSGLAVSSGFVGRSPARLGETSRWGFAPPRELLEIAGWTAEQTLSAAGVPPILFSRQVSSSRQEERRFLTMTCQPVADRLASEFARVLQAPVSIKVSAMSSDVITGLSRSVGSLVKAGLDLPQALEIAGLLDKISGPPVDRGAQPVVVDGAGRAEDS